MKIRGSIGVYSVSTLGEAIQSLIAEGTRHVVVDLEEATSIDSSGVGTLVGNSKSIAANGGKVWLVSPNERIRKMLDITGLSKYFEIRPSGEDALAEIGLTEICETIA